MDMAPTRVPRRPESQRGGIWPPLSLLALALLASTDSAAQVFDIQPRVDTMLSWTDNAAAGRAGRAGAADGEDWIAEVTPGVSIGAGREGGRLKGSLNANLRNPVHVRNTQDNTVFVALSGSAELEAIEDRLFFDADASISRSNQSLYSGREVGDTLDVAGENEHRVWSFGPRLEFRVGDSTRGTLSYLSRWLDSSGRTLGSQRTGTATAQIADPAATRLFGWGLDYRRNDTRYADADTDNARSGDRAQETARATLYIRVSPELRLRAIAGHEANDYSAGASQSSNIQGGGFDWNPGERTAISGTVEKRVFGRGYDLSISHRMSRTMWNLGWVRDIQSAMETLAGGGLLDPEFRLLFDSPDFLPELKDPYQREMVIRRLLGLPQYGTRNGIQTAAHYVSRGLSGGMVWSGRRNVVALSFSRTDRARLDDPAELNLQDDLRDHGTSSSKVAALSFSHRLTPSASLTTTLTRSQSKGQGATAIEARRTLFTLGLSTTLGPRTVGALQYRHQRFDDSRDGGDFTENALIATLGISF